MEKAKKRKGKLLGIAVLIIIIIAVAIGIGIYNTPTNRINRHLDLGQKYLEEQDYEQALVEFDKAIAIDPKNIDAYIGKAQTYQGMGDIELSIQTLEEAYEKIDSRRIEDSLISAYMEQSQKYIDNKQYDEALNAYDRLLELDRNDNDIQSGVEELLQEYINSLTEQQRYDEIQDLEEKYADKASKVEFPKAYEQIDNPELMQNIYRLMNLENWEELIELDKSDEVNDIVQKMDSDRYIYLLYKTDMQSGTGIGIYKKGAEHYFYCGDYSNGMRDGYGVYYETSQYDGYNVFWGDWKNDAPNGQGKEVKYCDMSQENYYYITESGNYANGFSDGEMNCILTEMNEGDFDLSYTAVLGIPDDITDVVHSKGGFIDENNIYAYDIHEFVGTSWNLHLTSEDDKLGVFGFEIISEGGNADTEVVKSENNDVNDWRDIYINYINDKVNSGISESMSYKLVNINNDAIPELYINYGYSAAGAGLCTIYNGVVIEQVVSVNNFSYIEGENLFWDKGAAMDYGWDNIYSIGDGEFILIARGECITENVQYDDEGEVLYDADGYLLGCEFYWNEVKVASSAEYNSLLGSVFDVRRSTNIMNELYTYDEIVREINNY